MNETILRANGNVITIGDAGSVAGVLARITSENTIPAVRDEDGNIIIPPVVPDIEDLALEMSHQDIKTHAWRLPKARTERLEEIVGALDVPSGEHRGGDRGLKLGQLDQEANQSATGKPGGRPPPQIEAERQVLRDLPPVVEAELAAMTNTDDMAAYLPPELH